MAHRRRRWRAVLGWGAVISILALCAGLACGWGWVGNLSDTGYRNASPPLLTSQAGVTPGVTHSRYVLLDPITVTLVNRSGAPIYLPTSAIGMYGQTLYQHSSGEYAPNCVALETDIQRARGWQEAQWGCVERLVSRWTATWTAPPSRPCLAARVNRSIPLV